MELVELGLLLKLGAAMMLIVLLLWAVRRVLMPHATSPQQGLIRVVEAKRLAEGRTLYLVRVGEHHLLLGDSKDSLSLLGEFPDLQVPASFTRESEEYRLFVTKATEMLMRARAKWLTWRRDDLNLDKHLGEGTVCRGQDA